MHYFRMLTNALIGGALVGAYVTLLVLQLNPSLLLTSFSAVRVMLTWWLFYGLHGAVVFYVFIVLRQVFASEMRSPGWLSLRLLAQFGTFALSMAAVVTWFNLRGFGVVLGPDAAGRMTSGATVLSVCAVICMILTMVQVPLARGRRIVAAMFTVVLICSLVVPLVLRGRGVQGGSKSGTGAPAIAPGPSNVRVSMILLDGASLDFIAPAAAGGRVPNFGRLLERGAVMHLATLRPTQPAPVWTAVSTGKLPYKTSVYSAARYRVVGASQRLDLLPDFCFAQALLRFHLLSQEDTLSDGVRARPIWELASSFGISSGVIGWPITYPARNINGFLVSDELLRRGDASALASLRDEPPLTWPPDLIDDIRSSYSRPPSETPRATDSAIEQIATDLEGAHRVQFSAVRYPGLDAVGHYYLRYAMPRAFGDVSDDERIRYGRVLEQYYTFMDGIVGRAMASLGPDDLLLVVSGFGMEPLSLGKRVIEGIAGDTQLSGSHEGAPDGFLMAYGSSVAKAALPRASVVDVAPTVLYFLGLPVARDMDGFARTDIFSRTFTQQRPIAFIPSYEK